ncbi:hypothetical protein, partial [Sicyoidochytrium minutum DNA virus]
VSESLAIGKFLLEKVKRDFI